MDWNDGQKGAGLNDDDDGSGDWNRAMAMNAGL